MRTRNAKACMNSSGKDADSLSTEFVSLATLREILTMQERMFKDMFESVLSSVNMRIDKVVKSVAELNASLEYSQQDIDDVMQAADAIDNMNEELENIQHEEKFIYSIHIFFSF